MRCYLCHANKFKILREKLRHEVSRKVLECKKCGLVFLDPEHANLEEFYKKQYRKLHSAVLGKELTAKEFFDINMPFQKERVEIIKPYLKRSMRVLDVGSSAGMFLSAVRPYVKECVGVEFDEVYAGFANEHGVKTYTVPLEKTDLAAHSFDLISALEVFEHIEDPLTFLKTVKYYLKPGGITYFEVPNHNDSLLSLFDVPGYRDFYYRQPHVFYYNPVTLKRMMERGGGYRHGFRKRAGA